MFGIMKRYKKKVVGINPVPTLKHVIPTVIEHYKQFLVLLRRTRVKLYDLPKTNYDLGVDHFHRGNFNDAIMRFTLVNFLRPQNADSYYFLGRSYIRTKQYDKASQAFKKALECRSSFSEARYMLDKIANPDIIENIPLALVKEKAEYYYKDLPDDHQEEIINAVLKRISDKNPNLDVLDLGCNKGEFGSAFARRDVVGTMHGVDIHRKNIDHARRRRHRQEKVYTQLSTESVEGFIGQCSSVYDVVKLSGVFSNHKHPDDYIDRAWGCVKPGGILVLTVRDSQESFFDMPWDVFCHNSQDWKGRLKKRLKAEYVQDFVVEVDQSISRRVFIFQ